MRALAADAMLCAALLSWQMASGVDTLGITGCEQKMQCSSALSAYREKNTNTCIIAAKKAVQAKTACRAVHTEGLAEES